MLPLSLELFPKLMRNRFTAISVSNIENTTKSPSSRPYFRRSQKRTASRKRSALSVQSMAASLKSQTRIVGLECLYERSVPYIAALIYIAALF